MHICIVYATFFPYHLDRIHAISSRLREHSDCDTLYALQLCERTRAYKWPDCDFDESIHFNTLIPSTSVDQLNSIHILYEVLKYLKSNNINVLFVPSYWPSYNVALLLAAKILNINVVLMTDSHMGSVSKNLILKLVKKYLINSFDAAFVAGQPQVSFLKSLGFSHKPLSIGFDCIDNSKYIGSISPSSSEFFCVLSVCRMLAKKNINLLIKAFKNLRSSVDFFNFTKKPRPKLLLVGNGPEMPSVISCLKNEGLTFAFLPASYELTSFEVVLNSISLDVDVILYDYRDPAFVRNIYNCAHVFVLPSLREEWGLVVNEAMSSALPIILSSQVGCHMDLAPICSTSTRLIDASDSFYHSINGYVFRSNSLKGLSLSLAEMYEMYSDNYALYVKHGKSSLDLVNQFSLIFHARNFMKVANAFR